MRHITGWPTLKSGLKTGESVGSYAGDEAITPRGKHQARTGRRLDVPSLYLQRLGA